MLHEIADKGILLQALSERRTDDSSCLLFQIYQGIYNAAPHTGKGI